MDRLYLVLCAPILLLLVFILPPFQAPDETAHFLRTIQLSHGSLLPMRTNESYRPGAGALIEPAAILMVRHYCPKPNTVCPDQHRPALGAILHRSVAEGASQWRAVTFSNTVIYLPVAHVVPALAIVAARGLALTPVGWLYAGRMANVVLTLSVTWLALRLLRRERAAPLVFALATLPMTLSVSATLGADAGVISSSLLLAAICVRLTQGSALPGWLWPVLLLAVSYAAAAKFAYLALAFVPLASALAGRQSRTVVVGTALLAVLACCVTLAWSAETHAYVFPISEDSRVDLQGQIAFVCQQPVRVADILLLSMLHEAPRAAAMLLGWSLSSYNVKLPLVLLAIAGLTLVVAVAAAGDEQRASLRLTVALIVAGSAVATFLFIYLQNSAVGGSLVDGYQGRYLLPLMPFFALIGPRIRLLDGWRQSDLSLIVAAGGMVSAISLTLFLALRIWD